MQVRNYGLIYGFFCFKEDNFFDVIFYIVSVFKKEFEKFLKKQLVVLVLKKIYYKFLKDKVVLEKLKIEQFMRKYELVGEGFILVDMIKIFYFIELFLLQ